MLIWLKASLLESKLIINLDSKTSSFPIKTRDLDMKQYEDQSSSQDLTKNLIKKFNGLQPSSLNKLFKNIQSCLQSTILWLTPLISMQKKSLTCSVVGKIRSLLKPFKDLWRTMDTNFQGKK